MSKQQYTGKNTDFYFADPKVADIVNLAIELKRPLLVEGEAGCGKTQLAYSVAKELGLEEPVKITVKSTTKAQDLLYRFDALRRLQDAQIKKKDAQLFYYPYLSLGQLGDAINSPKRRVVLLDEIDKADIDFPNDLLDVLDTFSFQITDLPQEEEDKCRAEKHFGRKVEAQADAKPIVIITSNREKRLPEPFLRRCLYIRLHFPATDQELVKIVRLNLDQLAQDEMDAERELLLETAAELFRKLRDLSVANDAQKPPTTSELIDWVRILFWKGEIVESLRENPYFPPYWESLFKTYHDLDMYPSVARASQKDL